MIIIFVEFIDQLIDFPINRASLSVRGVICGVFRYCLTLLSPSFGALGRLCFVIVAFPGYLHLYFYPIEKVATLKGKSLLPFGSKVFPFRVFFFFRNSLVYAKANHTVICLIKISERLPSVCRPDEMKKGLCKD